MLKHFKGDYARRFVDARNTTLHSSHRPADEVLVTCNRSAPDWAIGFFKAGCLLALVARSKWTVDSLERSLVWEQDA